MDIEYASFSKRSVIISLASIILLTVGYFYLSHHSALRGSYIDLKNRYNSNQSRQLCHSRGHKFLTPCFKREFYEVTRESNPYTRTYLAELLQAVYLRDLVLAHTDREKALLKLDFIEQSYTFLLLIQRFKIDRQNLQAGAMVLARFKRASIVDLSLLMRDAVGELENDQRMNSALNSVEINRLKLVSNRIKDSL